MLKRLKLPIVPIILGMVLGSIMEQKFRAGLARVDGFTDFINRPISFTIFCLIVVILVVNFYVWWRAYRQPAEYN